MKKTLLLFLIATGFLTNLHGQSQYKKGIVVTNNGDTISGLIAYREGSRSYKVCNFKKSKGAPLTKYSPDQIQSYGFVNDMHYESKPFESDNGNTNNFFFEVLVKGKLTLYKYSLRYFVEKNGDGLHELTNKKQEVIVDNETYMKDSKRYLGVLNYLTADCENFTETLIQSGNGEKDLTEIVEKYNRCKGEESISYKEKKPWFKANFGVLIGLNSSQINFSSANSFDRAFAVMPGVNLDILSPRINEKFSFHTGLFYLSTTYLSYYENNRVQTIDRTDVSYIDRTDITIDAKQLKIPLGFKYMFSEKELAPYINGGASYTIQLETSSNFVFEREANNVVYTTEGNAAEVENAIGYWGGVGLKKSISEKLNAFVEMRYENSGGVIDFNNRIETGDAGQMQNVQLLIGIIF